MAGAVLNDNWHASSAGGFSAGGARFTDDRKPSPATVARRDGWLQRAARMAASLVRRDPRATLGSGSHQILKGEIEHRHLPKGGRIRCQRGKVWITADGGGEDVVLSCGDFRWFRAGTWLLIEAIAKSEIIVEA